MSEVYFITGTDTGVGKTAVAAALAQRHVAQGRDVVYFKPVQTGVSTDEDGDAQFVAKAADVPVFEGQRYRAPLAPAEAALQEDAIVPWNELIERAGELAAIHEILLVEGAGGLLVPVDEGHTMADFAIALTAALVVVAHPHLGTLNHTALTLAFAARAGIPVDRLIICAWPSNPGLTERSNLRRLGNMTRTVELLTQVDGLDTARPSRVQFELVPGA